MRNLTWLTAMAFAMLSNGAIAADDDTDIPEPPGRTGQATAATDQATPPSKPAKTEEFGGPIWDRANLLGDPGGLRSAAARRGLTFNVSEQAEVLGNPTGGVRRGIVFEGLLSLGLSLDTEKAGLWSGGTFTASAYQIHGRGLSRNNLGDNLNTVGCIEAERGTLLFELWYEQALFDKKVSVRGGQLAANQEFSISQYAELFSNHGFGWSTLSSADLPSGGPSYPLATPGVRVRFAPVSDWTALVGVFNGDPARRGTGLPQSRDAFGTAFRLNGGTFVIGEVQHKIGHDDGLPGTYKLGAWYNSNTFADQLRAVSGLSLAAAQTPAGTPGRGRRGNWSVYAIGDQLVWRKPGTTDQGIGVFAQVQGAPGDRNLVNFAVTAGVTWKGFVPGREEDTAGLAFGLARISDTASQLDRDTRTQVQGYPIRRHESVLELTYQVQVTSWLQLQPMAQYLFNINGGVPNPAQPTKRIGDAAVLGLRSELTF